MSIPAEQDITLLLTALQAAFDAEIMRRLAVAGFPDLRVSHGYIFQHLLPGPVRISDLAERLGMTPQGASKFVIELEALVYVRRRIDPADRRNREVELTDRGMAGIEAARAARAEVNREVREFLGSQATDDLLAALRRLADHTGGMRELLGRRLRPR
jgi:DNA-binding MarR family transcriptional regulator